jgi:prepilin-type N-terminal cleavage/methylation domain-containing protein
MRSERGFSLIEVMTALAVTLVVLALAMRSFSDALKVDDAMKLTTEVDQNLQAAQTYVVKDLVDTSRNWPSGGIPFPTGGTATAVVRPGTAAAAAAGYPSATVLSPLIPGDGLGPTVGSTSTDTITVCFMDGVLGTMDVTSLTMAGTTATMVLANTVTINTKPENTIAVGDIFYIVNGTSKVLQQVTAINAGTRTLTFASGGPLNLNQPGATSGNVGPLVGKTDNKTQRLKMVTYYIDNTGTVPMLMRQDQQGTNAVALGITNFQIAFNANVFDVTGALVSTNITTAIFPTYTINQVDQAQVMLAARSDRVLRMSNRYISNDMITQVSFRSINTKQDYNVTP